MRDGDDSYTWIRDTIQRTFAMPTLHSELVASRYTGGLGGSVSWGPAKETEVELYKKNSRVHSFVDLIRNDFPLVKTIQVHSDIFDDLFREDNYYHRDRNRSMLVAVSDFEPRGYEELHHYTEHTMHVVEIGAHFGPSLEDIYVADGSSGIRTRISAENYRSY